MLTARLACLDNQAHEHAHDYHQLVLSLSGRAEFEVDGCGGEVCRMRACLVPGDAEHQFAGMGDNRMLILDLDERDTSPEDLSLLAELFASAYRQRARLAVLEAGGAEARWLWQGQKASPELHAWLNQLGAGGGTPVIEALQLATPWLLRRQRHKPGEQQRLLLLTDGRLRDWPRLNVLPCPALLLDIERAPIRLGRARQLASELGADYLHIDELAPASRAPTWNRP